MTYPQYGYPGTQLTPMRNGLGTASLVLGIVAVVLSWIPFIGLFGFICGVVGIALGIGGIIRGSKAVASNRAMAIVGTVLSSIAVIISLLVWTALANAITTTAGPATGGRQQTRFEAGQAADVDGMLITVGRLQRTSELFRSLVCSNVQYENRSGKTRSYSSLSDWKLQNPNGVVVTPTLLGETLGSGELVPGGHVTGKTCFEDPRLSGEYLIIH